MSIMDNKITPYDVKNIILLNNIMNNNEYYRAITGTDTGGINHLNVHTCTRILELHTYLVKNYTLIPKLFGNDMYDNYNKLQYLLGLIADNNAPISSVFKSIGII